MVWICDQLLIGYAEGLGLFFMFFNAALSFIGSFRLIYTRWLHLMLISQRHRSVNRPDWCAHPEDPARNLWRQRPIEFES